MGSVTSQMKIDKKLPVKTSTSVQFPTSLMAYTGATEDHSILLSLNLELQLNTNCKRQG